MYFSEILNETDFRYFIRRSTNPNAMERAIKIAAELAIRMSKIVKD